MLKNLAQQSSDHTERKWLKHIAAKNNEERQDEGDGQLFERLNIPEDICEFPGPDDETMREAAEAAELVEAEAADTEREQQLNFNCDNCANGTSIEKRLTLKIRALEKTKKCLQKKNKDQKNELDDCRSLLAVKV